VAERRRFLAALLGTALGASLALGGCASAEDPHEFSGTELGNPYETPDIALTDTDGASYSLAAQTDKPLTLVFFGFTNCPDICTMVMANIASAMTRLDEADRDEVEVVFVTTDPARDDEAALRRYLDRFDEGFTGLTGDLADIVEIGDSLGVYIEKGHQLPTGGYDVAHTTHVFAIDGDDQVPVTWPQETTPAQLAGDVTALLDGADKA
jgi:protein SCO1/2